MSRGLPRMSRTRVWLFGLTVVAYVAIVVGVVTTSKLVTLDWQVMLWRPYKQWPQIHAFLDYFVVLGQRGPTAVMVLAWLGWRAWRHRTLHPLLVLGTSLLLLNITVGAVKYGLGRLGPHYATTVGSAEMFAGGDIFPSGHTANAVVTWGVLAYLATTPRARRWGSIASALLALGVGATTVYLGTHWVSDVLLGWAAGLLILLALPWFEPFMARAEDWITDGWLRVRSRRARPAAAGATVPAPPTPSGQHSGDGEPDREPVGSAAQVGGPSTVPAPPGALASSGGLSTSTGAPGVKTPSGATVAATAVANPAIGSPAAATPAGGSPTSPGGGHPSNRPPTVRGDRTPPGAVGARRRPVDRQTARPVPPLSQASSAAHGPRPR
ncbi:Membrane-associated phospholipid phosphatase [Actinacidiphila yanglinensis]|uniref:Membrane-associated phospholipid phosphatase n=1 Tax=Actinacidiphila yanglinensis TaxID=310779 RepID=A0A1H6BDY9_9ACTN|nr:Membrane-associated phospholipid phosphatase [Actinacidiphila yanglinensis]